MSFCARPRRVEKERQKDIRYRCVLDSKGEAMTLGHEVLVCTRPTRVEKDTRTLDMGVY